MAAPEQQVRQLEFARHAEHRGDIAVRQRAQHAELGSRRGRHRRAAPEQRPDALDQLGRPMRQVGKGALLDLAIGAVTLAQ